MASIHSDKENALVASLIFNETGYQEFNGVWIGASCPSLQDRDFTWADGSDFKIDNWASGQPSSVSSNGFSLISISKLEDIDNHSFFLPLPLVEPVFQRATEMF